MLELASRQWLSPALAEVVGNADYVREETLLKRIDELLMGSGLEEAHIRQAVEDMEQKARRPLSEKQQEIIIVHARRALRCTVLRLLTGEAHRVLAKLIAGMPLYQWFCQLQRFPVVRPPAKSTLQRYEQSVTSAQLKRLNALLVGEASGSEARGDLRLKAPLDLDGFFMDTTCVEPNIHFPVDWVLLRDGTRTLIKAMLLIRRHGLKRRMPAPETFMRSINRQCIAMAQTVRRPEARKKRKAILREMKRVAKIVRKHAGRYRQALSARRAETDLTENEAGQISKRLDSVITQLPEAMRQAHERIIGGRPVPNEQKILSLYESDLHVVVRGKARAEVEFGNTLLLCEQRQGIVVDFELFKDAAPADAQLTGQVVEKLATLFPNLGQQPKVPALAGDRGFHSRKNDLLLAGKFFNAVASKAPHELTQQRQSRRFVAEQNRRSQTEARVSIVKRCFIGDPLRNKGFASRSTHVAWAVLAHNLWVIARLPTVPIRRKRAA
jgi:hypothetical protein